MAFLTESNFYIVTFKPTTAPEWGVLPNMPSLSTECLAAIVSGDPHLVFVTGLGVFSEEGYGPGCSGVSDTILESFEGPLPVHVLADGSTGPVYFAHLPDGDLAAWDGLHRKVVRYSEAAKDLLVAFLAA